KLAGGVAHDFNNLLTVILGNISLLQSGSVEEEQAKELLSAVERAGWSAAELVRQLLGFSRQTILRKQPTALGQVVAEMTGMLRRTMDPRIHLKVQSSPELWPVFADSSQMNQVVMNLCLNARDAMPEGGELTIEAKNLTVQETQAGASPGEYVRLSVSDSGIGI